MSTRLTLPERIGGSDFYALDPSLCRLLALMSDVLAAALLLESATAELNDGNGRMALVARLFVETRLHPLPRRGIAAGRDWTSRHFDALAFDGGVETADLVGLAA